MRRKFSLCLPTVAKYYLLSTVSVGGLISANLAWRSELHPEEQNTRTRLAFVAYAGIWGAAMAPVLPLVMLAKKLTARPE